jgi:hypothetical protein
MSELFLVQIDDKPTFLSSLRDGKPYGTSYPTQAIPMSFDAANELCTRFRAQGYDAFVVDRFGQPPTAADLMSIKKAVQYQVTFAGNFFLYNGRGQDCGTRNRDLAPVMSQDAAVAVMRRLKRRFPDAAIVEASSPVVSVDEELARLWPAEFKKAEQ